MAILSKLAFSSVTPANVDHIRERIVDNMAFVEYIVLGNNGQLPTDYFSRHVLKYVSIFPRLTVVKLAMPAGILWAEEFLRRSLSPNLQYIIITGIEAGAGHPSLLHPYDIADAMDPEHKYTMVAQEPPAPLRWVFAASPGSPSNQDSAREMERRLARELFRRMGRAYHIGFDSVTKHPRLAVTTAEIGESVHSILRKCDWKVNFGWDVDEGEPLNYQAIDNRSRFWSWTPEHNRFYDVIDAEDNDE